MKTENTLGVVASVNRPLSNEECQNHLDSKIQAHQDPFDQVCTIRINSTYLESVDVYDDWRGALSAVGLFFLTVLTYFLTVYSLGFVRDWASYSSDKRGDAGCAIVLMIVVFIPLMLLALWMVRFESFRLTHCPIRLNRKNRTVYMFRRDGTATSVPWDDAFFVLWSDRGRVGLQCHILDQTKKNVLDTFTFDYQGSPDQTLRLWEYVRRYMEEGPQAVINKTSYCLPLGDRKEPAWFGFVRLLMNFNGWPFFQLLLSPILLVFALGRAFSTLTCKRPKWPQDVEEVCAIEPGDPYVKDSHNTPVDLGILFGKPA